MVIIRLSRGGAKKRPFYHIVVADSRCSRDGRNLERVGYFNPITESQNLALFMNLERVNYWLSKGAKLSERVAGLVKIAQKMPVMEPMRPVRKAKPVVTPRPAVITAEPAKSDKGEKSSAKKAPRKNKSGKPAVKKASTKSE